MFLSDEIDNIINRLNNSGKYGDIVFIKAYPYAYKPTKLNKKVAVISPETLDLESISVDNVDFYGEAVICVTLYSPYAMGSPVVMEDMQSIMSCVMSPCVSRVSLGTVVNYPKTECYTLKAIFGFGYAYKKEDEDE